MTKTYKEIRTVEGALESKGVRLVYRHSPSHHWGKLIHVDAFAGSSLADPLTAIGTPETLLALGEALVEFAQRELARSK